MPLPPDAWVAFAVAAVFLVPAAVLTVRLLAALRGSDEPPGVRSHWGGLGGGGGGWHLTGSLTVLVMVVLFSVLGAVSAWAGANALQEDRLRTSLDSLLQRSGGLLVKLDSTAQELRDITRTVDSLEVRLRQAESAVNGPEGEPADPGG